VAGRFAYSKPSGRGPNDPWFRLGKFDIGSAALLGLMCAVSVIVYALEPIDKPILTKLALIPSEVRSGEVWRVFTWPLANGGPLLRGLSLFDVYRGEQIGPGKKSLAYSLTYQSDRTMTDAEAAAIRNKIIKRLEYELGAKLRS